MNDFVDYSLKSALCLSTFFLLYWIYLKNETYFLLNRAYLILSVVLAAVIPILPFASPFRRAAPEAASAPLSGAPLPAIGQTQALALLYGLGVIIFLLRFLAHLQRILRVVSRYGIRNCRGASVVFVDRDCTPFSFFSLIFVPEHYSERPELRHIIVHERIHIRQGHSFDIMLMELLTIVQWFNPFVWPYKRYLKETHEYLADDGVIAQGFNAAGYRVLLFEQHVGAKLFEFANNFKQSQIKRRLTMMTKNKSRGAARLKLLLALPLAALLVLTLARPRLAADDVKPGSKPAAYSSAEERAKMKQMLETLMQKAETLQKEIAATADPEKKAALEADLKKIEMKEKEIALWLKGEADPPANNEAELLKLQEIEKKLEVKLNAAETAEERAKIQQALDETRKKRQLLQEKHAGVGVEISTEKLKETMIKLQQMEAEIKEKLKGESDPEMQEKLKQKLEQIRAKQLEIKEMLHDRNAK